MKKDLIWLRLRKGKTYEEIYGKKRAKIIKRKLCNRLVGKTWEELYGKKAKEMRRNHSKRLSGKNNPHYGHKLSKKRKEQISLHFKNLWKSKEYRENKINSLKKLHLNNELEKRISNDSNFAYFLGAVLGDGSIKRTSIEFYVQDKDFANAVVNSIKNSLKILVPHNKTRIINGKKYYGGIFNSIDLCSFIKRVTNNHKTIPSFIYSIPNNRKFFLRGFFDAEGTASGRKISIPQKSKKILEQLFQLLILEDIVPTKIVKQSTDRYPNKPSWYTWYTLHICHPEDLNKFYTQIGFNIQRKQKMLKKIINKSIYYPSDKYWSCLQMYIYEKNKSKISNKIKIPIDIIYHWVTGRNIPRAVKRRIEYIRPQNFDELSIHYPFLSQ